MLRCALFKWQLIANFDEDNEERGHHIYNKTRAFQCRS